ncbi:MAG: TylF/MycF/NovP-related O-methyltransferase [Rhodothermales bacterium]
MTPDRPTPERLRLLHVHTFYPEATEQLYRAHPELKSAPYDVQIKAVLDDGVAASHIFTPYLAGLGYEAQFVVADNPYAQAQWLREHVTERAPIDQNSWVKEIVRKQVAHYRPDIFYTANPVLFDTAFIASLPYRPRLVAGWRAADIDARHDWSGYDLILSGLPLLLDAVREGGARASAFFFPGIPQMVAEDARGAKHALDVMFSGSWTTQQHETRNRMLERVAEASKGEMPFSFALYTDPGRLPVPATLQPFVQNPVFGRAMHRALGQARIVLDARADHSLRSDAGRRDLGGADTVNMRLFEATGAGAFLLTQHLPDLHRYFEPGREIETYRDHDELIEKIRYYLAHPDEREAIARRGQERCLRDYAMPERARVFDRLMRAHIRQPEPAPPARRPAQAPKPAAQPEPARQAVESVEGLLRTAIDTFKTGQYQQAFQTATRVKAMRLPLLNVDYLRAACLLHLGKPFDAREALREELHHFPDNANAKVLLDQVLKSVPDVSHIDDAEFKELLALIRPHTMVPEARLYSLYTQAKRICQEDLPGNFVECGVARGGSTALLGLVIQRYSRRPRHHFAFDTFSGMPEPTVHDTQNGIPADDTGWGTGTCAGSVDGVREICDALGISSYVSLVPGYFEDTLAGARQEVGPIALLHLDADWYSSTMTILNEFYDQVVPGGVMQFDDYGCWEGCQKATDEFQQFNSLSFPLQPVPGDNQGMWMVKA